MVERHYFKNRLLKSFDFDFGFCMPNSRNSCEHVYEMPALTPEEGKILFYSELNMIGMIGRAVIQLPVVMWLIFQPTLPPLVREVSQTTYSLISPLSTEQELIAHPYEIKSDSFYFVENQLAMHNKADYAYTSTASST